MTTKKTASPRPTAETPNHHQHAHHHHAAPEAIRDVPVDEQFNYRSAEKARLLEELRQALIAGAAGDSLNHLKSGQRVTLRDGTTISRS
jgi:hypothetical protein